MQFGNLEFYLHILFGLVISYCQEVKFYVQSFKELILKLLPKPLVLAISTNPCDNPLFLEPLIDSFKSIKVE